MIENLSIRKSENTGDFEKKTVVFTKFLELSENLHHYWLAANYDQKEQISKNLLWNLIVEGAEVRSGSWLQPFSKSENVPNFLYGRAWNKVLELNFCALWEWVSSTQASEKVSEWLEVISTLSSATKPKFPISRDIGQISGTKVY